MTTCVVVQFVDKDVCKLFVKLPIKFPGSLLLFEKKTYLLPANSEKRSLPAHTCILFPRILCLKHTPWSAGGFTSAIKTKISCLKKSMQSGGVFKIVVHFFSGLLFTGFELRGIKMVDDGVAGPIYPSGTSGRHSQFLMRIYIALALYFVLFYCLSPYCVH